MSSGRLLLRGGVALLLALQIWRLVHAAVPLYFVWLGIGVLYALYQARFLYADYLDRPEPYDLTAAILFVLDLTAHVAVAVFCRVGWLGVVLLAFAYFWTGRFIRDLALTRIAKEVLQNIDNYGPDMDAEKRIRVADVMVQERIRKFYHRS